jgi:hypothetical protein
MGLPIPDAIADPPELDPGLQWYLSAFFELSTDRSMGFGPGPIPGMAIRDFAKWYQVTADEFDDFVYLIRELDAEWLDWTAKQSEKKSKAKPGKDT